LPETLTLNQLKERAVAPEPPFQMEVPGREPLICEEICRFLPGKRLAFRAHWGGADVLVKLFFQRKYLVRERSGLKALADTGVPCPQEVWSLVDESGGYFIATEFLQDATSLQDCYEGLSIEQMRPLLRDALNLIGELHRAGWMQADIHLDNFLLSRGVLHVVDGGGVEPLSSRLNNVALFFAQMIPDYDALVQEVIGAYGHDAPSVDELLPAIIEMREQRIKHYLAKTVRTCTQFKVEKTSTAFIAFEREVEGRRLNQLMAEPEVAFGQAEFLKRGNTATVVKVAGEGDDWVLKRYNIKNFWHGLSRCLRPSRAWISWQSAHRFELLGIATAKPLAMRENRSGPFRREAYLVCQCLNGDDLQAWLLKQKDSQVPHWLSQQVVRLFDILWHSHVSHGDMKATNFIVTNEGVQLIDLDAVAWHSSDRSFIKAFRQDLQRFMANWQGNTWNHFEQLLSPIAMRAGITLKNKKV
jgi:tRNA A-37 threonylcarbamoyl transferase component Bud32